LPLGKTDKPGNQVYSMPSKEIKFIVRPETPPDPLDARDWADSPLYKFVSEEYYKELLKRG